MGRAHPASRVPSPTQAFGLDFGVGEGERARLLPGRGAVRTATAREFIKVEVVAPHSLTRTDFKARRVIDDREVFRGMNAQLAGADR